MVQKRANLFFAKKNQNSNFLSFWFSFFSTVYKSEKYRHSPSIGSCHDPHNLSIWGVQWIGEFWVGRAGANFSWYKRIIHVWQMLTSIIKIKSITQNILIISHDLNNGLLLFNVVVIIVIVRYKQYRDRYYDTAEKGSKTENWKLMMEGTSLLNFL